VEGVGCGGRGLAAVLDILGFAVLAAKVAYGMLKSLLQTVHGGAGRCAGTQAATIAGDDETGAADEKGKRVKEFIGRKGDQLR